MSKLSKRPTEPSSDPNADVFQIVQQATGQPMTASQMAAALGRLGGLKGGKARAAKLSAKRRRAIARKAARFRWIRK